MRREFQLPAADVEFLDSKGFQWETLLESNVRWVIIHNYPIPEGYNVKHAIVAMFTDVHYPTTQIDMLYFLPSLTKKSGRSINAIANRQIDGKQFQQWSRHRTPANPWRPGEDNLSTHLGMFDIILLNELSR